jgi:hypothetical protein
MFLHLRITIISSFLFEQKSFITMFMIEKEENYKMNVCSTASSIEALL